MQPALRISLQYWILPLFRHLCTAATCLAWCCLIKYASISQKSFAESCADARLLDKDMQQIHLLICQPFLIQYHFSTLTFYPFSLSVLSRLIPQGYVQSWVCNLLNDELESYFLEVLPHRGRVWHLFQNPSIGIPHYAKLLHSQSCFDRLPRSMMLSTGHWRSDQLVWSDPISIIP